MTEPGELFQRCSAILRASAVDLFKVRAEREGLIITICGWCNAYISEQPGRGVTGLSHGCCQVCFEKVTSEGRQS